jgi:hypothetical protein
MDHPRLMSCPSASIADDDGAFLESLQALIDGQPNWRGRERAGGLGR